MADMLRGVVAVLTLLLATIFITGCDAPDPEAARARMHLPPPGFVGHAGTGRSLFVANCSKCHGSELTGTDKGPPLLHKLYRTSHHADLTIHFAVRDGVKQHHWQFGNMPPVEGLSPEQVEHIVSFIRQQQHKAGIE